MVDLGMISLVISAPSPYLRKRIGPPSPYRVGPGAGGGIPRGAAYPLGVIYSAPLLLVTGRMCAYLPLRGLWPAKRPRAVTARAPVVPKARGLISPFSASMLPRCRALARRATLRALPDIVLLANGALCPLAFTVPANGRSHWMARLLVRRRSPRARAYGPRTLRVRATWLANAHVPPLTLLPDDPVGLRFYVHFPKPPTVAADAWQGALLFRASHGFLRYAEESGDPPARDVLFR